MSKKLIVTVGLVVVMLMGCGRSEAILKDSSETSTTDIQDKEAKNEEVDNEDIDIVDRSTTRETSKTLVRRRDDLPNNGDSLSEEWLAGYPVPLSEVAYAVLHENGKYTDYYTLDYTNPREGWIKVRLAQSKKDIYCFPGAIYPSDDWKDNPDVLIESYRNQTVEWPVLRKPGEIIFDIPLTVLWTEDYEHCFEIDEDWLYIDGMRSRPMFTETYSMDPKNLIADFLSGEWDGEKRYLKDGNVSVEMSYSGLWYTYDEEFVSKDSDPLNVAWPTAELPTITWNEATLNWVEMSGNFGYFYNDFGGRYMKAAKMAYVSYYADMPDGGKPDAVFDFGTKEDRVAFKIENQGVSVYHLGDKVLRYEIEEADESSVIWVESTADVYGIFGDKMVRLCPGGKVEKVQSGIVGYSKVTKAATQGNPVVYALENGNLLIWQNDGGAGDSSFREITRNVTAAEMTEDGENVKVEIGGRWYEVESEWTEKSDLEPRMKLVEVE